MELILLVLIAGAVGYFLAGSRFSEPIDETTGKVAETSRGWASSVGDWWRGLFGKRQQEVVDVESYEPAEEETEAEKKPAQRRASRRKSESESETEEAE